MSQTLHFQQYDFERKFKKSNEVGNTWSVGDTYVDKLLKLNDIHDFSYIIAIVQKPSLVVEIFNDSTIDVLSAQSLSLFSCFLQF